MKYNSKRVYNKKIPDGGAMYNSGTFTIIILDNGYGLDEVKNILSNLSINEIATATENIHAIVNIDIIDNSAIIKDEVNIINNVNISDLATGNDLVSETKSMIEIIDTGKGIDNTGIVSTYFLIDENNILQPLGVLVTRDSRCDLLPSTKDNIEEVPGKHGEFYFGKDFKARAIEINAVTKNGLSELEKLQLQRQFAKYLNPNNGAKNLVFADDMNKTYLVKYNGKISFNEHATWLPFTIPFKMSNPYIAGAFESMLVGSGKAFNDGNKETPILIKIVGPVTNPTIQIGSYTLSYNGNIATGDEVVIDTHLCTATLNENVNVLDKINSELPYYLPVGENIVTASNNVTILWRSRWI